MKKRFSVLILIMLLAFALVLTGCGGDEDKDKFEGIEAVEEINANDDNDAPEESDDLKIAFTDVDETHWAFKDIKAMAERGVIKGFEDGSFQPNNPVKYSEFIKMVVIAATGNDPGPNTDGINHWAGPYYNLAASSGILSTSEIKFEDLDQGISRGDMAYLIANTIPGSITAEQQNTAAMAIKDIDKAKDRQAYVLEAYYHGVVSGGPGGFFAPDGVLVRAEAASVMANLFKYLEKQ